LRDISVKKLFLELTAIYKINFSVLKRLKIKKHTNFSNIIILIISILFALLIGSGLYGYGIDYWGAYAKGLEFNSARLGPFSYLSFWIATLTIFGFHIGVYITTFILTLSTGFLIREQIKSKKSYSIILFLLTFLIAIHTWPIIMSTSNAMRQGLCMSFIFFSLTCSYQKNYYRMIFFILVAILMHKIGILLGMIIVFATILNILLTTFSNKNKVAINFLIGILSLIFTYYFLNIFILSDNNQPTRIIAGDYRWAFVLIAFIYVAFSFFYRSILTNSFNLSLYYYSFISLSLLMNGLNWQYERLGMVMIIPYILSIGSLFNRSSYKIYLVLAFLLLLLLTIYTGMYTEGLRYEKNTS
jgi:hypothetical protein